MRDFFCPPRRAVAPKKDCADVVQAIPESFLGAQLHLKIVDAYGELNSVPMGRATEFLKIAGDAFDKSAKSPEDFIQLFCYVIAQQMLIPLAGVYECKAQGLFTTGVVFYNKDQHSLYLYLYTMPKIRKMADGKELDVFSFSLSTPLRWLKLPVFVSPRNATQSCFLDLNPFSGQGQSGWTEGQPILMFSAHCTGEGAEPRIEICGDSHIVDTGRTAVSTSVSAVARKRLLDLHQSTPEYRRLNEFRDLLNAKFEQSMGRVLTFLQTFDSRPVPLANPQQVSIDIDGRAFLGKIVHLLKATCDQDRLIVTFLPSNQKATPRVSTRNLSNFAPEAQSFFDRVYGYKLIDCEIEYLDTYLEGVGLVYDLIRSKVPPRGSDPEAHSAFLSMRQCCVVVLVPGSKNLNCVQGPKVAVCMDKTVVTTKSCREHPSMLMDIACGELLLVPLARELEKVLKAQNLVPTAANIAELRAQAELERVAQEEQLRMKKEQKAQAKELERTQKEAQRKAKEDKAQERQREKELEREQRAKEKAAFDEQAKLKQAGELVGAQLLAKAAVEHEIQEAEKRASHEAEECAAQERQKKEQQLKEIEQVKKEEADLRVEITQILSQAKIAFEGIFDQSKGTLAINGLVVNPEDKRSILTQLHNRTKEILDQIAAVSASPSGKARRVKFDQKEVCAGLRAQLIKLKQIQVEFDSEIKKVEAERERILQTRRTRELERAEREGVAAQQPACSDLPASVACPRSRSRSSSKDSKALVLPKVLSDRVSIGCQTPPDFMSRFYWLGSTGVLCGWSNVRGRDLLKSLSQGRSKSFFCLDRVGSFNLSFRDFNLIIRPMLDAKFLVPIKEDGPDYKISRKFFKGLETDFVFRSLENRFYLTQLSFEDSFTVKGLPIFMCEFLLLLCKQIELMQRGLEPCVEASRFKDDTSVTY